MEVVMPSTSPMSLSVLENKIEQKCGIDLRHWRRDYSYRWISEERRFSQRDLSFLFRKGPYSDLKASSPTWRDIRDVVRIDDRRGISTIYGHFNLETENLTLEVGKCPSRQS